MKKLLYVFIAVLSISLMAGCGKSKEITCTYEQDTENLKQAAEMHAEWNGKKLDKLSMKITFYANNDTVKDNWNYFAETLTDNLDQMYVESKGIKFDSKVDNDNYKYVYTMNIDLNKATDKGLEKIGLSSIEGSDTSYEAAKKEFEKQGYTCK